MKTNEKGITLISVIVIIILLLIIGSVVVYNGQDSIKQASTAEKIKELEIIQAKVNVIYEEQNQSSEKKEEYASLGESLDYVQEELLQNALQNEDRNGYRYFSKENLKQIQLENMNQDVLINFETRRVISLYGIEIDGTKYYNLYEIPNHSKNNIEYIDKNNEEPTFEANVIEKDDMWIVKIVNIKYNSKVQKGQVSYKLQDSENWILANDTSFKVYKPGIYDIMLQDSAGNSTIIQKEIQASYKIYPYILDGALAYYDGENNTGKGHSNTTVKWKNLITNNNEANLSMKNSTTEVGWKNDGIVIDTGDSVQINMPLEENTSLSIEVIFTDFDFSKTNIINANNGWDAFSAHTFNSDGSIYIGGNFNNNSQNRFSPSEINYKIPLNKPISLVYTYDNTIKNAQVYINGRKMASKQYMTGGKAIESFQLAWANKKYSRICIYNKSITQEAITNNYEIDKYRFGIE